MEFLFNKFFNYSGYFSRQPHVCNPLPSLYFSVECCSPLTLFYCTRYPERNALTVSYSYEVRNRDVA
jgi:hypothetical protein